MANAVTSGLWSDVSTTLPRLVGLNTNQVNWGIPANRARRQSGYRFIGRTVPLRLDGEEFVLGTFTHNNFPVRSGGANRFTIKLSATVTFDTGGFNRTFNFTFNHHETPNIGNKAAQADRVGFTSVSSSETMEIEGESYAVKIVGFKQQGEVVNEFVSFENSANSAVIVAKLVHIAKPEIVTDESTTYTFEVLNPDGSVFGKGCFTYAGAEQPVDLAHIMGGGGSGTELTSFWYRDPLVGSMDINQLLSMNFVLGVDGKPSRFTLNAANVPEDSRALAGGIATADKDGSISVHRGDSENSGCAGRKLTFPSACYCEVVVEEEEEEGEIPKVDLVVVMDSSVSMRPEAISLSDAISASIESAKSKCPSDLKVTYLGIEGRFSKTLFDTTIRQHLTDLGVAESDMRGRKRGTVAAGGAQEDGARAIEDVSLHHNWRTDAMRAIFYLSDEGMEGGDAVDNEDIEAATRAIDVATTANVRVHTYLAKSKAKPEVIQLNEDEFKRVAESTEGQFFKSKNTLDGFETMLEKVICASKVPVGVIEITPCPCTQEAIGVCP